jgi:hypothetical protein
LVRTNEAIGVSKAFCPYLDPIDAKRSLKKSGRDFYFLMNSMAKKIVCGTGKRGRGGGGYV